MFKGLRPFFAGFLFAAFASSAGAISLAELAYNAAPWTEACQKPSPPMGMRLDPHLACIPFMSDADRANRLNHDFGKVSEDALLSYLAKSRADSLDCAEKELSAKLQDPASEEELVAKIANKVKLYGYAMKKLTPLRAAAGSDLATAKIFETATQSIAEDLEYSKLPVMRNMYEYLANQSDYYGASGVSAENMATIKSYIRRNLHLAQAQMKSSVTELNKGVSSLGSSLDDPLRESLVQDYELVAQFLKQNKDKKQQLHPFLCRLNSKYGTSAKVVQTGEIIVGTVAAAVGLGWIAGISDAALVEAVISGAMSVRTAAVLRIAVGTLAILGPGAVKAVDTCLKNHPLQNTTKSCGGLGLESEGQGDCVMAVIVQASGAVAGVKGMEETMQYFESKIAQVETSSLKAAPDPMQKIGTKVVTKAAENASSASAASSFTVIPPNLTQDIQNRLTEVSGQTWASQDAMSLAQQVQSTAERVADQAITKLPPIPKIPVHLDFSTLSYNSAVPLSNIKKLHGSFASLKTLQSKAVEIHQGSETISGFVVGINDDGSLTLLRQDGQKQTLRLTQDSVGRMLLNGKSISSIKIASVDQSTIRSIHQQLAQLKPLEKARAEVHDVVVKSVETKIAKMTEKPLAPTSPSVLVTQILQNRTTHGEAQPNWRYIIPNGDPEDNLSGRVTKDTPGAVRVLLLTKDDIASIPVGTKLIGGDGQISVAGVTKEPPKSATPSIYGISSEPIKLKEASEKPLDQAIDKYNTLLKQTPDLISDGLNLSN